MLGEGIVSFGVAVVTASCTNVKASAKIGSRSATRSSTCSAAGENSIVPSALRNWTLMWSCAVDDAAELVDEVHVPRGAAELAVGGRLQPDLLLLAHDVADRLVLDAAQLVGVDASPP